MFGGLTFKGATGQMPMHIGGRSMLLEHIGCICPFTQTHWHAAFAGTADSSNATTANTYPMRSPSEITQDQR